MAKFEDIAVRYMVDLIRDFHLRDFQSAAVPGNGGHESGGFTQLQELNPTSGRGGLGHFQDTGPRRLAFEQWLARNADKGWTAATYEANYSFLFRELIGSESAALEALRKTSTLEEATEVFCDKFERPGVKALDSRIQYARRALAAFKASGIDPNALKAPDAITPPTHDILAPQGKIDLSALAPIINTLLPVLLQLLAARTQQPGSAQQGQQPDILALLAPLLTGGQPPAPQPVIPPPPPPVVVTKSEAKPSVGLGLLGLFGSAIGMATGAVGTPFGLGTDPTTAGTLSILIPAAISAVGATGILGPFGAIAARVASAAITAATAPKS